MTADESEEFARMKIVDPVEAAIIWTLGEREMARFSELVRLSTAMLMFVGKDVSKETVQNRLKQLTKAHYLERVRIREKSFYRIREGLSIEDPVGYLRRLREKASLLGPTEERERRRGTWEDEMKPVLRRLLDELPVVEYHGVYFPSKVQPLRIYDGRVPVEGEDELSLIEERKGVIFLHPGPQYFLSTFKDKCATFWEEIRTLEEELDSRRLGISGLSETDRRQLEITLLVLHSLKKGELLEATLENVGLASERNKVMQWSRELAEVSGGVRSAYLSARNRRKLLVESLENHLSMPEPPGIEEYARSLVEFREP